MEVIVRNGNIEKAMRIFKRKIKKSGILTEIKEKQHYSKPSEKKRLAKKRGIARWKKDQQKREQTI